MTSPLAPETTVLLTGSVKDHPAEPVAWTFLRQDGGRSFYTSMGHVKDFGNADFVRMLLNGICWAVGMSSPSDVEVATGREQFARHWSLIPVPASWKDATSGVLSDYDGAAWYRCVLRLREEWVAPAGILFEIPQHGSGVQVWLNGFPLARRPDRKVGSRYLIRRDWIEANDANLLVVRIDDGSGDRGWQVAAGIRTTVSGETAKLEKRLAEEAPGYLERFHNGEFPSIRKAAIAAGIHQDSHSPLMRLKANWKKASASERRQFRRWLKSRERNGNGR